jgi:hypothetical protein
LNLIPIPNSRRLNLDALAWAEYDPIVRRLKLYFVGASASTILYDDEATAAWEAINAPAAPADDVAAIHTAMRALEERLDELEGRVEIAESEGAVADDEDAGIDDGSEPEEPPWTPKVGDAVRVTGTDSAGVITSVGDSPFGMFYRINDEPKGWMAGSLEPWCPKDGERVLLPDGEVATVQDEYPESDTVVRVILPGGRPGIVKRCMLRPYAEPAPAPAEPEPPRLRADVTPRDPDNVIIDLRLELDRVRAERDGALAEVDRLAGRVSTPKESIEGDDACLARLRAAVGPFAKAAGFIPAHWAGDDVLTFREDHIQHPATAPRLDRLDPDLHGTGGLPTVADWRRLAEAVKACEPPDAVSVAADGTTTLYLRGVATAVQSPRPTMTCPNCGEAMDPYQLGCFYCGRQVRPISADPAPAAAEAKSGLVDETPDDKCESQVGPLPPGWHIAPAKVATRRGQWYLEGYLPTEEAARKAVRLIVDHINNPVDVAPEPPNPAMPRRFRWRSPSAEGPRTEHQWRYGSYQEQSDTWHDFGRHTYAGRPDLPYPQGGNGPPKLRDFEWVDGEDGEAPQP